MTLGASALRSALPEDDGRIRETILTRPAGSGRQESKVRNS